MDTLDKPTNVNLTLNGGNITISWDEVENAQEYEVWRKTDEGVFQLIHVGGGTEYVDPSLPTNKTYQYYVEAIGEDNSYTVALSEKSNTFTSFFDYHPSMFLKKGFKLFSLHPNNDKVYEHFKGEYNTFYGVKYPSYVTLQINPQADLECVFNNIEFKSELYIEDIDQPDKTITHLQLWNEYQDSGRKPLTIGINSNMKRKFRSWRAQLPREAGSRDRIRGPWCFLTLELDSIENSKLVLHDVNIYYTI